MGFILLAGIIVTALLANTKLNKIYPEEDFNKSISLSAKASLISILTVALFSFPFHVLPNFINFMFLLALISAAMSIKKGGSIFNRNYEVDISNYVVNSICIIAVILSVTLFYKNVNRFNVNKIWKEGYDKASFGFYNDAIKDFSKIYSSLSSNGNYLFNYGGLLLLNKNYKSAVKILKASTKTYSDAKQHIDLGIAYSNLNDYKNAETEFLYAMNMKPDLIYPEYLLTELYIKENKLEKAKLECERILNRKVNINSSAVQEIKNKIKILLNSLKAKSGYTNSNSNSQ